LWSATVGFLNQRPTIGPSSTQDQHDDDDEQDEANEAAADVDTRCDEHDLVLPNEAPAQTGVDQMMRDKADDRRVLG
jgi:hypothetical protein